MQIRVDELPEILPVFNGFALINIWMDLQSSDLWEAENGNGFVVRAYANIDDLAPIGPGYRESSDLPSFPVFWREVIREQPDWEDMAGELPLSVAQSSQTDWFFQKPICLWTI
ncbi:MAG: hypothetical protein Q4G36_09165 [Paracoccus sp. (in: a-proteobacteria)]|nr:hypothetical protein [Paracoccus sp. (in: a-proteobacteria)]